MSENQQDSRKQKFLREEYISRINRVIDYIERNIDKDLSLENLASVAHFSPFHFHLKFLPRILVVSLLTKYGGSK